MSKEAIRKATLGQKQNFKSDIVMCNGVEIEIKQLTIFERNKLSMDSVNKETNTLDIISYQINSIIYCCYVPNTEEKVFDDTDKEVLKNSVSGGFADQLWEKIQELHYIKTDEAPEVIAKKN